ADAQHLCGARGAAVQDTASDFSTRHAEPRCARLFAHQQGTVLAYPPESCCPGGYLSTCHQYGRARRVQRTRHYPADRCRIERRFLSGDSAALRTAARRFVQDTAFLGPTPSQEGARLSYLGVGRGSLELSELAIAHSRPVGANASARARAARRCASRATGEYR